LATTLNNLGLLMTQIGSGGEAESLFTEAIALLDPTTWQTLAGTINEEENGESYPSETHASILCNLSGLLTRTSP
jgi:hypothetical protein